MIARACTSSRFGTVGPVYQRQARSPAVNAHGARGFRECGSPRSINRERGRGESLTSSLSVRCPCFLLLLPGCAPPCPRPRSFHPRVVGSLYSAFACNGPASAHRGVRASAVDSVDGDVIHSKRASEWRAAGAERGGGAPSVDRSVGDGPGAQPSVCLRCQLHSTSTASPRWRVASCGGCATTTWWSSTTSP
jgi:hypothetical protein